MQRKATSVAEYLKSLPTDRRAEIERVREVVNRNLDRDGYEEGMSYGMICWVVPHRVFPDGYHCKKEQALPFLALASQKNYCSVYVPIVVPANVAEQHAQGKLYRWFVEAWKRSGKKLDMGKCCVRFQRADELALDVIGELVARLPAKKFVASYVAARDAQAQRGPKPREEIRAEAAARAAARKGAEHAPKRVRKAARKPTRKGSRRKKARGATR
ncbi:MAG: DUF1801 domain-containing protein [Planctomycetes bacterium]|nr:DUF1801 domain-containing protein [Planctomycetota bacterium]